ncbi:MAG: tetratricopeptide repeat protein [Pseudomonadota bacterium]|nr:tetratricopeptide repeat protein [Pseudomonadota bacterium]
MKRAILIVLLAVGLAACAGKPRTEPPAPVERADAWNAKTKAPPSATPGTTDESETVEVYAYRPPSSAPDAAAPEGTVPAENATPPAIGALPSESASPTPGGPVPSETPTTTTTTTPQVVAYAPPPPAAPALPPAADGLAKQAEQQRQMGDYVGAAATLERALRIQPQEAYLWNRLARVRMEQGLYSQAGNLAERSNALAKDQASLKQDNWSIIAVSRRTAGNAAGAAEAEEKARGG